MKIEDSPFPISNSVSPLDKLRRTSGQGSLETTLDDMDLSFLDLLTNLTADTRASAVRALTETAAPDKLKDKEKAGKATSADSGKVTRLPVQNSSTKTGEGEFNTRVDDDFSLSRDELSVLDVQYLKQQVIPALPILVGSVPFNSVFPAGPDGEISYKGFDVSSGLAELIEKGYKTGQPIRVELDNQSAVVLKIRNGQVSAEFVSTDKAGAFVMQQELDDLRNRMAARNLPVGTLEYKYQDPRQNRQNQSDQENSSGNKAE